MDSDDGETHLVVEGQSTTALPDTSIFPSLDTASEFFKRGSLGYSPASKPGTFDGLELRIADWHVKPLGIARVESSFFESHRHLSARIGGVRLCLVDEGYWT